MTSINERRLEELLAQIKQLARQYTALTGRPLGVTGEIAEYEAARLLEVELAPVRQSGYDAIRVTPQGAMRLQIKGRCLLPGARPSQRVGAIKLERVWDAVVLVLLDQQYEATAIHEAGRDVIAEALNKPGSRARNARGQLSVSEFIRIGHKVWPAADR